MPSRKEKNLRNRDHMRFVRSFPSYSEYQRAMLYRQFSGLVDVIDFKRKQLPDDERSKSQTLDLLYSKADALIVRLKRLNWN